MIAFAHGERVSVSGQSSTAVPNSFTWRGRRHWVQAVEGCKVSSRKHTSEIAERVVYQLRTISGMRCTLTYDPAQQIWRLERILSTGGWR